MGLTRVLVATVLLAVAVSAVSVKKQEIRLIETKPGNAVWMTEDEILNNLIQKGLGFIDITDHQDLGVSLKSSGRRFAIPTNPTHQSVVQSFISKINIDSVRTNLNTFTAFNNRYYTSTTGQQSSNWLFQTVQTIAAKAKNVNVTVSQFRHTWIQSSVIARIAGSTRRTDIVVIGAHQDSINQVLPANGRAPGADDDGSGSVTILEVFRVLIENGFQPEVTIEFQWYSAEEVGLRGSQAIVSDYVSRGVDVRSMVQIDMDGYDQKEKKVAIITDNTDSTLNAFLRKLVESYLSIGWVNSECGYGCSDHASFDRVGYPAAFPFEAQFSNLSPYIHTAQDTVSTVSFTHINEFIKLGLAYIVELSYDN